MRRVLLLGLALMAAGYADPAGRQPRSRARYVEGYAKSPQVGDLAGVLHIGQMEGKAELYSGFRNVSLVLAAYKGGQKVDLPGAEVRLPASHGRGGTIRYGVDIVDLDFLPLGGGKKGHCRVRASFSWPDGSSGFAERDIPKRVIDLSASSQLAFTEAAAAGREVPLLWFVKGGPVPVTAETREQVLGRVKAGDLLFVTLRFDDPGKD